MKYTVATRSELATIIHRLNKKDLIVFDTETTGLEAYQESEMFSLAVCDGEECVYFNFRDYGNGFSNQYLLERSWIAPLMHKMRTWVGHNVKFDLHFTDRAGVKPFGRIIDTETWARVYQNHFQYKGGYSLDVCAKRWLSVEKDDRVKKYMDENNLYFSDTGDGGREFKNYQFYKVPFELISEYAMKDAEVTWALYQFLKENMYQETEGTLNKAIEYETTLTPILFEMEKTGLLVDKAYCETAYKSAIAVRDLHQSALDELMGKAFVDSSKELAPYLNGKGYVLPETEKGNKQITDEVLSGIPDPVAEHVLLYREAQKRATTYFGNYINKSDVSSAIHPNFRQAGTVTGRMSCNNPNLQNVPTQDDSDYPVRRCFVPRPDHIFVSIDYDQMEFRLMLDYAGQEDLIEQIKAGLDPHNATASLTGLNRDTAKTLNFGIIYRMGLAKLGKKLSITETDAGVFRKQYFAKMPKVKRFIYDAPRRQEERGFTYSWAGRRFYLDEGTNEDGSSKWSYKAANAIIQGGCADICKLAMVEVFNFLGGRKSRMVLQVHDEILFEIHKSEINIVPKLQKIMESVYPYRSLPLTCSVAYSEKSFHDMIDVDDATEIGKALSGEGTPGFENPTGSVLLQSFGPG